MSVERSAGAVIFTRCHFLEKTSGQKKRAKSGTGFKKEGKKPLFLLLCYPFGSRSNQAYWDLPKGHIEKGEKPEDAAKRETEEETGLKDINFIKGFKETIKYFFQWKGENVMKFVTFFLAETKTKKIIISEEHIGYKWLPYKEALDTLTFDNAKEILKKANEFLSRKGL